MGLDMYLYEIRKSGRQKGFEVNTFGNGLFENEELLSESEYKALPKEYKRYCVKGTERTVKANLGVVLRQVLDNKLEEIKENNGIVYAGTHITADAEEYMYRVKSEYVPEALIGFEVWLEKTTVLKVAYHYERKAEDNIYLIIKYCIDEGCLKDYKSRLLVNETKTVYSCCMDEIEYQRKGLNETGRELLPENCVYCADKSVVKALCERGGLQRAFLNSWQDGVTLFQAWW